MHAIIFRTGDNPLSSRQLARQYLPPMVDSKQVRVALRQLRTDKNLTPEELADASGVNRATVYRIEDLNADYTPRIETVSALAEALGLSISAFFLQIEGLRHLTPVDPELPPQIDGGPLSTSVSDHAIILSFARALGAELAESFERAIDRAADRIIAAQSPSTEAGGNAADNSAVRRGRDA